MGIRFFDPSEPSLEQQATTQAKFAAYQAAVTPQYAQQVTQMFRVNPNLRPGTGLALARANVDPAGPIAQAAVKAEAQRRQQKGFGFHSIGDLVGGAVDKVSDAIGATAGVAYDAVKGFSRGTWMGLEALPQTIQGAFRESVKDGDISGSEWALGLGNWGKGFQQTSLAAGIDQIQERGLSGLDYGSGFFTGGQVRQTQIQRARAAAPLIDNHAASLGRYAARQVFEPGSKPYGLLSGTIDASVLVAADPTSWLGGGFKLGSAGAREAIERSKTFAGSKGDVVRETAVEMTPARQVAKQFGDEEIDAGQFLDKAVEFGSDNPSVQSAVRSFAAGELSREDALARLEDLRPRIAVEAGIVEGTRKTILSDVANAWLTMNDDGRRAVRYFAAEQSVAQMRRATKGKIDTETLVKLTAARDDNEVISILGPLLGKSVREKPVIDGAYVKAAEGGEGFSVQVKNARASSRWAAMMPHKMVDLDDLDDAVEQIDRLAATVKMPLAKRDEFVNRMAATTNRNQRLDVTKKLMAKIQDDVISGSRYAGKMDANQRAALTRLYGAFDDVEQFRAFALDELGNPMKVPGAPVIKVGDETVTMASPHLLSEHVGQYMPLPDAQDLRRATSKVMNTLAKIPGATRSADALIVTGETITKVFKAGALARIAYPIRVIGEEQARIAASGHHSAYAHPASYLAMIIGHSGGKDILDNLFTESTALGDAMSVGSAGMFGQKGKVRVPGKRPVPRTDPECARALADNLSEFHNDALAKRIARGGLLDGDRTPNPLPGVDGIKDWFFHGAGRGQRNLLATGADSKGAPKQRSEIFAVKNDPTDPLNSSDGYVDSMIERLRVATNGDTRLMAAIADGVIDGVPLMRQVAPKQYAPNPDAVAKIQQILDEGPDVGPAFAKGDIFMSAKGEDPSFAAIGRKYDAAVEKMFEYLMSKPTNKLSRNPAFQQFYWKRQAELIGYMRPEVQQQALRVARETKLPERLIAKMEKNAARRSGDLNFAEADDLGKAFAVDSVKKLLYDLHDRNQFFDAMRVVFPFGEAWKEVATTWGRIGLKENPLVFRRGQQIVNGLRSANVDGEDEGLFFTNGNGEESFALPFSGWINEKITGVDAQFTAPVKGLNVFGSSVIPGLGPVITMPLAKIIPNRPEYSDLQELLFPFGEKEYEDGALGGFTGSLMPTWSQKIKTAFTGDENKDRIFANQVAYSARYLLSTGKYSLDTAEEKDRLERDSIKAARRLYMLRGLAQIWAPSAPSPEYVALDRDGQGVLQSRLVEEYQKLLNDTEGGGYKTATERFVERFGEGAILSIVARTSGGAPPTKETNDFATTNPDVVRQHRETYGFFLERGGEFNYQAYKDQILTGERKTITPKEAIEIANQRLGQMVYNQYKAQIGTRPNKAQKQWLGKVRDAIEVEYPGFNATPGSLRNDKLLITKMVEAAKNPILANTEAGKGLTMYLQARDAALGQAQARGLKTFTNAKSAADLRAYLRDVASEIEIQYPAFGELFERTFNREMIADDQS